MADFQADEEVFVMKGSLFDFFWSYPGSTILDI